MDNEYQVSKVEGIIQPLENELGHAYETRIYILDHTGKKIGKAALLKAEDTSRYFWKLFDISCSGELPTDIEVITENWVLDALVFYEGFGFLRTTTHTAPLEISHQKFFVSNRNQVIALPNSLFIYRVATLKALDGKE